MYFCHKDIKCMRGKMLIARCCPFLKYTVTVNILQFQTKNRDILHKRAVNTVNNSQEKDYKAPKLALPWDGTAL